MFGQFRQNALEEPGKAFTRMERIIRLVEELEQQNHIRLFTFAQESSLSGTNGDGRIVLSELARIYTSKILEKPELLAMMAYADQPKVETPVVEPENYFTAWYHEQQIEFPVEMMDQVQQSLLTGGSLNYLDPAEVFRSSRELFAKILQ